MTQSLERRVRRPEDKTDLLESLATNVFDSYADALAFAACVGYGNSCRRSFEESGEPIRFSVFENRGYGSLPDFLALAETRNPRILGDDSFEDRIRVFEEYANGGLEILRTRLEDDGKPLDCSIALINEVRMEKEGKSDLRERLRRLVGEA